MEEQKKNKLALEKFVSFVETQPTEVWHQMVMDWNWDNSDFLNWFIQNPNTDKATILMIYWNSAPAWGFEGKEEIESKYIEGFYTHQQFYYDPTDDRGIDWTTEYAQPDTSPKEPKEIPEIMYQKLSGKEVSEPPREWIEGMPPDLFYEIEEILYDSEDE